MKTIDEQLILHEGLRLKPYVDTAGKITIGVGRNLSDNGITVESAGSLLTLDIAIAIVIVRQFTWFDDLDRVRAKVLIDMAFNLGGPKLKTFKNFLAAMARKDYNAAADEMLNSVWATQVPVRANRLAKMIRTGKDYDEA